MFSSPEWPEDPRCAWEMMALESYRSVAPPGAGPASACHRNYSAHFLLAGCAEFSVCALAEWKCAGTLTPPPPEETITPRCHHAQQILPPAREASPLAECQPRRTRPAAGAETGDGRRRHNTAATEINSMAYCKECRGKGSARCPKCGGRGRIDTGFLSVSSVACRHCEGSGKVRCGVCKGRGSH